MSHTSLDFLWLSTPPWVYVGVGETEREKWLPSHFYSRDGIDVCVRRMRGSKMRTASDLMNEVGAALQLPDAFGENWYALEESLCYLDEWLPADAYVLVVEQAENVLLGDEDQMGAFLATVHAAGEFWAKPVDSPERFQRGSVPFHVLLNVSGKHPEAVRRILGAAAMTEVPVRRDRDER